MSTNMEVQKPFYLHVLFVLYHCLLSPPKQECHYKQQIISRCGSYPVTQKAAGNIGLPAMEIL